MSTCFKALDTSEGQVFVLTKTRWMGFVPMPHTSVTPHSAANLTRLGVFIKWTTNDPPTLARLHDAIVRLVEGVGISGLAGFANDMTRTEQRVAKISGVRWHDVVNHIVKEMAQEGVAFPVPDDVLRYIKAFG
jgi:hypothetical protein